MLKPAVLGACLVVLSLTQESAPAPKVPEHVRDPVFNRALGVECAHCHGEGTPGESPKPTLATARNMLRMVVVLNEQLQDRGRVECATCHGGTIRPSRLPRPELDAVLARWPAGLEAADSVKLTMAVYSASLGVGCDHCHAADWKSNEKLPFRTVTLMNSLFAIFPKHMPATARTQCYMCHKGSKTPTKR